MVGDGLTLTGDDGQVIPCNGAAAFRSRIVPDSERLVPIPAGETRAFPLQGMYRPKESPGAAPEDSFNVTDRSGLTRWWTVHGPAVFLTATLPATAITLPQDIAVPADITVRTVPLTAPRTVAWFDLTAHRAALLSAHPEQFALALTCDVPTDKPFYSLRLQTAPVIQDATSFFVRTRALTTPEALALIDALAKAGLLRNAIILETASTLALQTGYHLRLTGIPPEAAWEVPLGWDLAMLAQLDALAGMFPASAKPDMALLLGRLSGLRAEWERAAAPEKHLTLNLTGATLTDAVAQVRAALACPGLPLTVAGGGQAPAPLTLQFTAVPARAVWADLAYAADYTLQVQDDGVTFLPAL
jgi:hypothetical protein